MASKIALLIMAIVVVLAVAAATLLIGGLSHGRPISISSGNMTSTSALTTSTTYSSTTSISTTLTSTSVTTTVIFNVTSSDNPIFKEMYESSHFKIYFEPIDAGTANVLIQVLEYVYPIDARIYGGVPPNKTSVYVFHTLDDARGYVNLPPTARENASGGGFDTMPPLGDGIKLYNTQLNQPDEIGWLRGGMAHELGHRFFYYLFPNLRYPVRPNWLDEGIAMYDWSEAGGNIEYGFGVARQNISANGPIPLGSLDPLQSSWNTIELFYGEAATVINYMVSRAGESKLREFLSVYNRTENLNSSFIETFGVNETMFEMQYVNCAKKISLEADNGSSFYYLLKKGC